MYLPVKPEIAKEQNLPVKLPILAEDMPLISEINKIPLDVILRGLEAQYSVEKNEYWASYLTYFYYEKFKELLNDENYEKARKFLEKAKNVMYDYRYHFYYGLLFSKLGDYDNAEVELKRSISLNPTFYLGYYELGNVLYLKKEYDESVEMYMKAFEINKDFALPLLKVGDAYFENGQYKDAEIAYQAALKVEKLPQIFLRLGVLYNTTQRFEKAEKVFKDGLSIEYKPEIAYNLAYTLSKLGKHLQALQVLKELSKNFPSFEVYNELGLQQKLLGLYEEASESLKLAGEDYRENYLKSLLFIDGYKDFILNELEKFDPEYVAFLRKVRQEKDLIESKLEKIHFPFKELEYVFDFTNDEGEVILGELERYRNFPFNQRIALVISSGYIAGADPILIEKNLAKSSFLLFDIDEAVVFYKVIQIIYFGRVFGGMPFSEIIEKVLEQLSNINIPLLKKMINILEYTKTSLDDFWENFEKTENLPNFILQLMELLSYEPEINDIKEETFIGKLAKLFIEL
ncbi:MULTISPECIES: tetratricopeptide repeat protein [unclassified Thermosipho (in: thermotogales)]|uniref:tetratricopeptide repeat protein n=1 Tax=unclassified Thermosipho (in: thermotogales) TaxID=2676525 RepID=UPI001E5818CE|nr:tetratricopeptide repeat protein [Thermosipho sp. 1223]